MQQDFRYGYRQYWDGIYYPDYNADPNGGKPFKYELIEPFTRQFNSLVRLGVIDISDTAISTYWDIGFEIGQTIQTGGKFYTVQRISRDMQSHNAQVARYGLRPIVRLTLGLQENKLYGNKAVRE